MKAREHMRGVIHDSNYQKDRRQIGATQPAVESQAQALSPGGACVGWQYAAVPGASRQQARWCAFHDVFRHVVQVANPSLFVTRISVLTSG
jgi:hypothetical protein